MSTYMIIFMSTYMIIFMSTYMETMLKLMSTIDEVRFYSLRVRHDAYLLAFESYF